jgi:hypothetical protein
VSQTIVFRGDGPFSKMVATFLASTVGLGPLFDPKNPLQLDRSRAAFYNGGNGDPQLLIDLEQVYNLTKSCITANEAVNSLCCMLVNTAFELVEQSNDKSPEFEFFRHVSREQLLLQERRAKATRTLASVCHRRHAEGNQQPAVGCAMLRQLPRPSTCPLSSVGHRAEATGSRTTLIPP